MQLANSETTISHQVTLHCTLRPKAPKCSRLKDVLLTLSHAVYVNEPGCLSYQIWEYKTKQDEVAFVLIENWISKEALDNHHNQSHLQKADKIIVDEELLVEEEEDRSLSLIGGFMGRNESHEVHRKVAASVLPASNV